MKIVICLGTYNMIRGFCTSILVNLVIVFITPFVFGQSPEPNIDGISIESQKRYKDTQDFIKKTQKRIDQLRKQSDLREKNIELLATKVIWVMWEVAKHHLSGLLTTLKNLLMENYRQ